MPQAHTIVEGVSCNEHTLNSCVFLQAFKNGHFIWNKAPRLLFLLFFLALINLPVQALDPHKLLTQLTHSSWSVNVGISSPIHQIVQTPDGYLWLGTAGGLYRFDGLRFSLWESGFNEQLPGSIVSALCAGSDGSLWIGFSSGDVSHLQYGHLTNYYPADGIPTGAINSIVEDKSGAIWAGGAYGLSKFENGAWRNIGEESGYSAPGAQRMFVDKEGNLWVPTDNKNFGLSSDPVRKNTILVLAPNETRFAPTGEAVGLVWQMAETSTGEIWISETSAGSIRPILRENRPELEIKTEYDPLSILFDDNDSLWIGYDGGFSRIADSKHPKAATQEHFSEQDGLSGKTVHSMFKDREGNIWTGTNGGLDRFSDNKVTVYSVKEGLMANQSIALTAKTDGSVWFTSYTSDSVQRFFEGRFSTYKLLPYAHSDSPRILSLYTDKQDSLWLGGSFKLARQTGEKFSYVDIPGIADGAMIEAVTREPEDNLWVCLTDADNIQRVLRLSDGKWTVLSDIYQFPKFRCRVMYPDSQGRVWLGFENGEIVVYEKGDFHTFSSKDGLPDGKSLTITEDHTKRIWIGGENGLSSFENNRFVTLKKENGLPSNSVSGILEDDDGYFWLADGLGILRINPEELQKALANPSYVMQSTTIAATDGLRGNPRQNAPFPTAARAADGKLWFATNNGAAMIDTKHLIKNNLPPPVVIEEVKADNHTVTGSTGRLELAPNTKNLEFHYTALSLTNPERVRFRFRLVGYDNDWRGPVGTREMTYTNLPPGDYQFRVIACNNDDVWNEQGATFEFKILPAFYQTNWFIFLCFAAAAALIWLGYKWRIRQVKYLLNLQFEERLSERTRIAQELHDTLLQGVLSASMQVKVAANNLTDESPIKSRLNRVMTIMKQVTEEGRASLGGLRAADNDQPADFKDLFTRIHQQFANSDEYDFQITVKDIPRPLHPLIHDEVYRIGREALINAFQHSNAGKIEVRIEYAAKFFKVVITDDGCGISPNLLSSGREGHWGLPGMKERAEKIGAAFRIASQINAGTQIEIIVPNYFAYKNPSDDRKPKWWSKWYSKKPL